MRSIEKQLLTTDRMMKIKFQIYFILNYILLLDLMATQITVTRIIGPQDFRSLSLESSPGLKFFENIDKDF